MRFALQCTFCVHKAILFLTPLLFNFGINIGFVIENEEIEKDKLNTGI